jgi:sporulation protein YlmC with PRC-barrel domain
MLHLVSAAALTILGGFFALSGPAAAEAVPGAEAANPHVVQVQHMPVSALRNIEVMDTGGTLVGLVGHYLVGQDRRSYAVLTHSAAPFDPGKTIAMPTSHLVLAAGRFAIQGLTPEQIRDIPPLELSDGRYRTLSDNDWVRVPVASAGFRGIGTDKAALRRLVREQIGEDLTNEGGRSRTSMISVKRLATLYIHNSRGEMLGDVESVVESEPSKRRYAVLQGGSFLGLYGTDVALPLDRVFLRRDRLMILSITDEEIDEMPEWRRSLRFTLPNDDASTPISERD